MAEPSCDFEPIAFPLLTDFQLYSDTDFVDRSLPMELDFIESTLLSSPPMAASFHATTMQSSEDMIPFLEIHQPIEERLNVPRTAMRGPNGQRINLTTLPSIKKPFNVPQYAAATSITPTGQNDRSLEISIVSKPRWEQKQ